jgi:hypothetical protein
VCRNIRREKELTDELVFETTEFEYGYNLKIYPDEPVEVAVKQNMSTGPSIGNWLSNLLSPVDASGVPPPPTPSS